ncbi:hypothetical protein SAMN05421786_11522 [Chryseobacterium ureilyticum]|uniref:Uncharacterized protein n=1 Tax=Chryseobacterium ureilyticum TaxID=373668 RepID=A0A1N7QRU9_9FLAO|nr:hypothetical protein [Chryseobacterium ureilyticum]SIT25528.1 hypothetical protein SAMN05421786_11522 [Chryseobacterium ureilyticum]
MKTLLTLDNSKLLVLNNSMQIIDSLVLQNQAKNSRSVLSICMELRTELLQKAIKTRQKDKSFVLKLSYHKAEALLVYLRDYEIYFPDEFGSYESNAILQMKNELHRQLI